MDKHSPLNAASLLALLATATLLTGCFGTKGSGNIETQTIELGSPTKSFSLGLGQATMEVVTGDHDQLQVTTDDNLLNELQLHLRNQNLRLETKDFGLMHPTDGFRVRLVTTDLTQLSKLSLSGSGTIQAADLSAQEITINLLGSGEIHLPELHTDELNILIEGSGDITTSGNTQHQQITISGSGDYHGFDLQSSSAALIIAGFSDLELNVSKELNVVVTGSSDIEVIGDPEVNSRIIGSGDITRVEPTLSAEI